VGDGLKIWFRNDVWCGDQTLKEAFPVIYSIVHFKEASVANHMVVANNICQ
jgi:hypothetical protein